MRKFWIYLFLFYILLNISFAYKGYNSTYGNFSLENNGWCENFPITFKIYNQTEFTDKKNIESNLCIGNQTPIKNHCNIFQKLTPKVKIYDGPFLTSPILLNSIANLSSEFKLTFNNTGPHLIELSGLLNFNDYYEPLFNIINCPGISILNNSSNNNSKKTINIFNSSFKINGINLNFTNSDFNSSQNLTIQNNLNYSSLGVTGLNNSINNFKVLSKSKNFSNLKITIPIIYENKSNIKIYILKDFLSNKWDKISNFTIKNNNLILNSAQLGIYSVTENKSIIKTKVIVTNSSNTNSSNPISDNKIKPIKNTNTSNSSNFKYYLLGFILIISLGFLFFYIKNKDKFKKIETHSDLNEHISNQEILTNYQQILTHTKDYVKKYKNKYSKDQIYRALKQANISSDIIDKAFEEEF